MPPQAYCCCSALFLNWNAASQHPGNSGPRVTRGSAPSGCAAIAKGSTQGSVDRAILALKCPGRTAVTLRPRGLRGVKLRHEAGCHGHFLNDKPALT
jgi:hypothetical protein